MSKGRMVLLTIVAALVVIVAFGGRIGAAIEKWLLALHGAH